MKIENWFIGVVEETADPESAGRVRVRCFNYHTPNHELLPTENLIWAQCILPVDNPGIGGVGQFAVGLLPGSWVQGFFRDGSDMQDPVIIGGYSGSAGNSVNYQDGFGYGDPHGAFKYSSAMNNFPADSNTFASVNGYSSGMSSFVGSMVGGISGGSSTGKSSWEPPDIPIEIDGTGVGKLVNLANNEAKGGKNIEIGTNAGPFIEKYWTAVPGKGPPLPYCAAFVCWCIENSGIVPKEYLPATAGVAQVISWAEKNCNRGGNFIKNVRKGNVGYVLAGDLIEIFNFSHIGIAITDSDAQGKYTAVDGNGPKNRVDYRPRTVRGTEKACSWRIDKTPSEPRPIVVQSNQPIPTKTT